METAEFSDVARRFHAGTATGDDLNAAFVDARFYCVMSDEPGFMAVGEAGAGYVLMYSSEDALVRAEGPTTWFAAIGADLLPLVPPGFGILIDHDSETQLILPPWAIRREDASQPLTSAS